MERLYKEMTFSLKSGLEGGAIVTFWSIFFFGVVSRFFMLRWVKQGRFL